MISCDNLSIVCLNNFIDKYGKSKNPMFNTRMEVSDPSINKHRDRINNENKDIVENSPQAILTSTKLKYKIHHLSDDEELQDNFIIICCYTISEIFAKIITKTETHKCQN